MKQCHMKLVILLIIVLMLILFIIVFANELSFCFKCGKVHVIHNYFSEIGLDEYDASWYSYATVIERIGEPSEVKIVERNGTKSVVLDYTLFALYYTYPSKPGEVTGYFNHMEIYSPKIELRHDIHVGSSRDQIIRAYQCVTPDISKELGNAYGDYKLIPSIYDNWGDANTRYVEFLYDENDNVIEIDYFPVWG